jgi:N utilization substance protein B
VALYQHDATGRPLAETLGERPSSFTAALAEGAAGHAPELDAVIARHARGWTVGRIHPLERSIMRIALLEMVHPELLPGEAPIPPEGAIDEAVRQTRTFCGAEAPAFVNGVLGAALRELRDPPAHEHAAAESDAREHGSPAHGVAGR